nr:B12-binding domain-containing protein [Rufibacter sp. LB8]
MPPSQVAEEVLKLTENELGQEQFINQLIVAMVELDEALFERVLSRVILTLGFTGAVRTVIYPFLHKIGLLWQTANITPAHEHFMSQLIRQKMLVAIDALPLPQNQAAPRVILFLPEGELHELALLYGHYLFRAKGYQTLYLGQHLPLVDVQRAANQFKAEFLFTVFTSAMQKMTVVEYLEQLNETVNVKEILITGAILQYYPEGAFPKTTHYLKTLDALDAWLVK